MEIHDSDIITYVTMWPTVSEILHLNHAWLYREQTKIQLYKTRDSRGTSVIMRLQSSFQLRKIVSRETCNDVRQWGRNNPSIFCNRIIHPISPPLLGLAWNKRAIPLTADSIISAHWAWETSTTHSYDLNSQTTSLSSHADPLRWI